MTGHQPSHAPTLQAFQRQYLRGLAHEFKPIVHVGQEGVTVAVVAATEQALADHELIKVRLHEPEDKGQMANLLAESAGAILCGIIGHTVILYRRHPKKPQIKLPERSTKRPAPV